MRKIILDLPAGLGSPAKRIDLTPLVTGKIGPIRYTKTIRKLSKVLEYCRLQKIGGRYYFIVYEPYSHSTDFHNIYNNNLMMVIDMVYKKLIENGLIKEV